MAPADLIPEVHPSPDETQNFRRQMGHISRQSGVFFAGTIFAAAAGYLFKVYLARALGPEALGIYALGMTIIGFLGVFGALGLPQSAVRFVAAYNATGKMNLLRGFLARIMLFLLGSNILLGGVVLLVGPWVATHFYHAPALSSYLGLFVLIMIFGALNTFLGQVLAGYKDVARRTVITNFIGSPLMMIFTIGLVTLGLRLWGYIFAQVLSGFIVLILLLAMVRRLTPTAARDFAAGLPPVEREVVAFSAVACGVSFLEFLMAQTDKVLIGFYLDASEVGIYAVAAALVTFVPIILQSVNQIFAPTIADLHARNDQDLLRKIFQTLTKWILGLTIPLAAVMIIFSRPLMRVFGHDFEVGWAVLVIGTLGQLVNCAVGSVGYLLLMSGNQRRLIRVQTIMAMVMVVLNIALIPRWGITGAAVAAAVTNAVSNICYLREVYRALGLFPYTRSYLRLVPPLIASCAVVLGLRTKFGGVHPEWIVIAIGLLLGYLVFIGIALAFGLDVNDRIIAQAAWSRVRGLFQES